MHEDTVRTRAFAMPLGSPAYPIGPYRFRNREYLIITYRTDPQKLRALVPEPLEVREPLVKFEFIRMPDSTGFGDYTESGQVIPVSFRGRKGSYTHCMFLNDHPPIAGGRELWGFPKKLASPTLGTEIDTVVGTLDYGPIRVATGTMGYKHRAADLASVKASLAEPNFLLKIIPHVDGTPRICELVEYHLEDVDLKGAWTGPASLNLSSHALAPVAELPVLEVVSAMHLVADLTLPLGKVVHDYLAPTQASPLKGRPMNLHTKNLSSAPAASTAWQGRLVDKVAVITGAASGIGKEIALAFAREGAKVVIADLDQKAAQETASEIDPLGQRALGVAMDVGNEEQVELGMAQVIETFGRLDILISNAGVQIVAPARRVRVRKMEEAALDPPGWRLPYDPCRPASDV